MRATRRWIWRTLAFSFVALVVASMALVVHDTWFTKLGDVRLTSDNVAAGRPLRILQLTDIHDLPRQRQLDSIVELASGAHPDLIAVTGDLANVTTTDFTRMQGLLERLVGLGVPVYFVPGNHEYGNAAYAAEKQMIADTGAVFLLNRGTALDGPWGALDVMGTGDYSTGHGNLAAATQGRRPGAFGLVLTHAPEKVIPLLADSGTDLVICGHTHAGQIRLPWVGALFTPDGGWLPTYDKGTFTFGDTTLYIDPGVGTTGIPVRFFNPSQITLIEVSHP